MSTSAPVPASTPVSAPARHFDYALADVFAERPLEGNMLAIFSDARSLTVHEMQALARETNLAETTFILPRDAAEERTRGVRVRIFTTEEELPFAGHPTLGTASWLYENHPALRGAERITLDLQGGPVTVRFSTPEPGAPGVYATMAPRDPDFGALHDPETISRVLGVPLADLATDLPIQTVSTGLPFCIVPLRSVGALAKLLIPQGQAKEYLARTGAKFFYVLAPESGSWAPGAGTGFEARMQFYFGEDPATGSAAGCAAAWLVRCGVVPGDIPATLRQGSHIGRPSKLIVQAGLTRGEVRGVYVSGRTIFVANGRFSLPFAG